MNKKVKWGVLSTAKIGTKQVIPAMQQGEYSEITAIASRNLTRSKEIAQQLHIPLAYGSYEELLADPSIEAIYIPLPNNFHVQWSIKCMRAGKHVLCEKPIALTVDDVKKLIEVRDKTGMKISEAFMVRSHPQWIKALDLVNSGALGEVKAIQGFFSYFNRDKDNIRNKIEYGGGSLWDIGCYPINTSRFLFNEIPEKVIALIENDPDFKVDRLASVILAFPSGQALFTSATQLSPYQKMTVFGTEKHLEIEIPFNAPKDRPSRIYLNDALTGEEGREMVEIGICDQYTHQGDNFSRAILEGGDVPVTLEDSLINTAVINAIFKSAESGKWENIEL
ncbi:MAG: Gfo/Idh/MocA family oxidoreductase [Spirochaetaceae bacterium]|nr:Gfo/Idh/MocA family oxidoreductase [Spirochaetaceae bacterium]